MIISMYKLICVTNRNLCADDFIRQTEKVAAAHPDCIILREKDLDEDTYSDLAEKVIRICNKYDVVFSAHYFYKAAIRLSIRRIHVPLFVLRQMSEKEKRFFSAIGVSCHSKEDAEEAEKLGASYITAGHIFDTSCKAGLPGRGLDFLNEVKSSVSIPVYAIGGISADNAGNVINAGADGICIMSGFMKCSDPERLISKLREVMEDG